MTCDPDAIKDIEVWGTVMEGRVLVAKSAAEHALKVAHTHGKSEGEVNRDRKSF